MALIINYVLKQIKADEFEASTSPWSTYWHFTVVCVQGWGIACLARVGSLNQKGHVFGIQVFYLLTWRCLEVVFTFLSIGSEEMVYKVWILKLGHCSWVGHLIPIFAQIFNEISHRGVC